ncbi:unnamed protein product [Toxocara canis]|uniref:Secreted protein n=1 Tax=Toxocara canis TaxID=6265 RepID=A0A183TWC7_TOXCA|nr:unnamed protein product [Toxocara canis]
MAIDDALPSTGLDCIARCAQLRAATSLFLLAHAAHPVQRQHAPSTTVLAARRAMPSLSESRLFESPARHYTRRTLADASPAASEWGETCLECATE